MVPFKKNFVYGSIIFSCKFTINGSVSFIGHELESQALQFIFSQKNKENIDKKCLKKKKTNRGSIKF